MEQTGDRVGRDFDAVLFEQVGDLAGGATGPLQAGYGVAGRVVLQQDLDGGDYSGRFFSMGLRPPPWRRMRPRVTC